ncbi:odorant receptor coreceptor [Aricia agestis]|uniref:odorant receptor coreceptor n=1 Tax=Aricia agestis TaxID=91739 RepID=UPI001C202203|nr:odorant receptor coreceptor [Aricia agestis]
MMTKQKTQGLVSDLMPNIKLMQLFGHFLFNYHADNAGMSLLLRKIYASVHAFLIVVQFVLMGINMAKYSEEVNELTANTITVLFFAHTLIKLLFFGVTSKNFYRTLAVWNQSNSHPLFTESNARYCQIALTKMRRLLYFIMGMTVFSVISWVTITFFDESVRYLVDKETNGTYTEPVPRLPVKAWYPFDAFHGPMYIFAFVFQVYWLLFSMSIANLLDLMFSSWLIFACEQLQHLKAIMKPLMEISASLDTYRPNTAELFRISSADKSEKIPDSTDMDIRGIYATQQDFGMMPRMGRLQTFGNNNNPNGLSQKQEILARSAIKYWVERHKHVVRLVTSIGDTYGTALLFHMLVSTITLTLLAYQATKINGINVYAFSTLGYLCYTLGQVFHFCIFGNRLIEESSSVMEAAYSCQWYDGSEEAKTFVQIVCQQCQKAMSISGAKFFTVSLDLFASVLGAVVTYFMVLVQLK